MKTIKEVKDSHRWSGVGGVHGVNMHGHLGMHGGEGLLHGSDKISQKDAKTIFEHAQKLEAEYKHLISGKNQFCSNNYIPIHYTRPKRTCNKVFLIYRYNPCWNQSDAYVCSN